MGQFCSVVSVSTIQVETIGLPLGRGRSIYYWKLKHFKCHTQQVSEGFEDYLSSMPDFRLNCGSTYRKLNKVHHYLNEQFIS